MSFLKSLLSPLFNERGQVSTARDLPLFQVLRGRTKNRVVRLSDGTTVRFRSEKFLAKDDIQWRAAYSRWNNNGGSNKGPTPLPKGFSAEVEGTLAEEAGRLFQRGRSAVIQTAGEVGAGIGGRERGEPIAERIADIAIPTSPATAVGEAAMLATFGPAAKLATTAGRVGARIGIPSVLSGVTAALTGDNPFIEAAKTAAIALLPEAIFPAARGLKQVKQVTKLPSTVRAAALNDAQSVSKAFVDEVASFKGLADAKATSLLTLRDPAVGRKAIVDTFKNTDDSIKAAFKGEKIDFDFTPTGVAEATEAVIQETGQVGVATVQRVIPGKSIDDALDTLKKLKQAARDSDPGPLGREARQLAGEAEQSFRNLLNEKSPALLNQYASAVEQFDKGLDLLAILKDSGSLVSDPRAGAIVDLGKLGRFLFDNIEKYPPSRHRALWTAVNRGGPLGAADEVERITLRGFVRGIGVVPGGAVPLPITTRVAAGAPELPSVFDPSTLQRGVAVGAQQAGGQIVPGRRALEERRTQRRLQGNPFNEEIR